MRNTAFQDFVPHEVGSNVIGLNDHRRRCRIPFNQNNWRDEVEGKLDELASLPTNWNGYGAGPVLFTNANFALRMIEAICGPATSAPSIVPGTDGDLQIEWHENEVDIELHVISPNHVIAWHQSPTTPPDGEEITLSNDFTAVVHWVREMMEPDGAAPAAAVQ